MMHRIHIWMNFPSHHQSGFFASLIAQGVDLRVTYYESISPQRRALGWQSNALETWETSLDESGIEAVEWLVAMSQYVQIIPGYGTATLRRIRDVACQNNIPWCHWSEASRNGWRWYLRLFTKRYHARMVNRHALGAFAQGAMARSDFMRWGIRADKVADLTYTLDIDRGDGVADQEILSFAQGRGVFLFVGRLDHGKAVDIQLRAFASLQDSENRWCLVMVGSGDHGHFKALAGKLGIASKVLFVSAVPWSRIAAIYRACHVLLLPSRYEGWGAVVNEACSFGLAIVASSACGAAWHLVSPGVNGYWVDPGSVSSLSAAMQRYCEGGIGLAEYQGEYSQKLVADYKCSDMATRFQRVLEGWTSRQGRIQHHA